MPPLGSIDAPKALTEVIPSTFIKSIPVAMVDDKPLTPPPL